MCADEHVTLPLGLAHSDAPNDSHEPCPCLVLRLHCLSPLLPPVVPVLHPPCHTINAFPYQEQDLSLVVP